ncbi:O-acetyltransferase OatA [Pandoraea horticolens]|uniref:O-acetyltransferase OatA n=1 Tax=Pandoraea horticolens TaxID=2508298 RepID=A0A5E4SHA5_9BURK|nr:acyltransferase family protein [Pandoraea horticolens]VVD75326.1 O-acetyltransferase OatA [Pandoraea horticolens]
MKNPILRGPSTGSTYRPDIDGLRAVAILCVVIFHAFPGNLPGGFVGVDVFFVISGFLISRIIFSGLAAGSFRFSEFYVHRVKRIAPALIVVLASCFALGWYVLLPDEFRQLGKHIAAGSGFVENFVLWGEAGYFDKETALKPLMHLWSLSIEEQFYIFYPLLVWGVWRMGANVIGVIVALGLCSFAINLAGGASHPGATFYLPQSRVWELMSGAVLAYAYARNWRCVVAIRNSSFLADSLSVLGIGLVLGVATSLVRSEYFPGWLALFPVFGAVLLIAAGPKAMVNRFVLSNRPMVFVGLISYPLYLWHWPLLSFAHIIDAQAPTGAVRDGAVVLSFALAWLTYRLVELPTRYGRLPKIRVVYALAVGLIAAMGLGASALLKGGYTTREAALANQVNKFDYPYIHSCQAITGMKPDDDRCSADHLPVPAPGVIVIGDSVSNAYSAALTEYSRLDASFSYFQFGRGECPMLLDYGPIFCRQMMEYARTYIAETPSVHTVVLASNWPLYFNGQDWQGVRERKETPEQFDRSFKKTVEYYQSLGKKVVVFFPPAVGADPRACVVRAFTLTHRSICDPDVTVAKAIDGNYRPTLVPYLAARNVETFDPFPALCAEGRCKMLDGQRLLWSDGGHMSWYGGQYLARHAVADLRRVFGGTGTPSKPLLPQASTAGRITTN